MFTEYSPMITTKKGAIEYTQKEMQKEFKYFTTKNKLNIKEDSNAENEERQPKKALRHIENKKQNERSLSLQ